MKSKIILPIIAILFSINTAFAQNWVTVTAENGKSIDLDLDSIKVVLDVVEYDVKTPKDEKGIFYVHHMSTELYKKHSPTAIAYITKYKNEISDENILNQDTKKNLQYKEAKPGTLHAEIFEVLSKQLDQKDFKNGNKVLKKYLKKQRKTILKKWQPHYYYSYNRDFEKYAGVDANRYYQNVLSLEIDKDGNVISRQSLDSEYPAPEIDNLEPLPEEYSGEVFNLNVTMKYYKFYGAKQFNRKNQIEKTNPNSAEITVAKNRIIPPFGHIAAGFLSSIDPVSYFISDAFDFLLMTAIKLIFAAPLSPLIVLGALMGDFSLLHWIFFE